MEERASIIGMSGLGLVGWQQPVGTHMVAMVGITTPHIMGMMTIAVPM